MKKKKRQDNAFLIFQIFILPIILPAIYFIYIKIKKIDWVYKSPI